jgi:protein-S-isoprenylcysteine O-methyltransferase Ste14
MSTDLQAAFTSTQAGERSSRPGRRRSRVFADYRDLAARVTIGGLFLALSVRILHDFMLTGRFTGLLLLASELLVVVLSIVRRPATIVDRTWQARAITAISILGVPLMRPAPGLGLVPDIVTASASACGLVIVIAGKIALGRSFGLVPAHRGLVCSGPYRLVRHPIYLGYLITHAAWLVANPTSWNVLALVLADLALIVRSRYEERTLLVDPKYGQYRARVRYAIVPGVL